MAFTEEQKTEARRLIEVEGKTRQQVADQFNTSYQQIYSFTKDLPGNAQPFGTGGGNSTGAREVVMIGDERRVDVIRRMIGEGKTRRQVADELNVPYQIVFAAIKSKKAKEEGLFDKSRVNGKPESASADGEAQPKKAKSTKKAQVAQAAAVDTEAEDTAAEEVAAPDDEELFGDLDLELEETDSDESADEE